MGEKWIVGVDIGGTTIKIAFISINGEVLISGKLLRIKIILEMSILVIL